MDFTAAVKTCFSKYAIFAGRARRSEYWWWILFTVLLSVAVTLLGALLPISGSSVVLKFIMNVALFLPSLAVGIRRLHDIGKSGWWILLFVIPVIGVIILLIWFCRDSDAGENAYGARPK